MDLDLNREQKMIQREVRTFAKKEILTIAGDLDEKKEFSGILTRKMGDIGPFISWRPTSG